MKLVTVGLTMKDDCLFVSEVFYSLQGEGSTMGFPSVFLRLTGCNLLCGSNISYAGIKSTWLCDTIEVWKKGNKVLFVDILKLHIKQLKAGAHLVITGGEPLLQQKEIVQFLKWFRGEYRFLPFTEIETNGTIFPMIPLRGFIDLWNCSPKLANSGENIKRRRDRAALNVINNCNSIFKFVIIDKSDWQEIAEYYLGNKIIDKDKIWLMPAASTIGELLERNQEVCQLALEKQVKFSTRLQVEIWNKTVGV